MIPRLHRRGNSFKGALGYVLHDPGKESSERVAWVMTQNIVSHPDDAWFEMFDTYRNRAALKKYSGADSRGRDNKTPVLHYTLAWHASDNPNPEHMQAMALDSLKALGLSEHEAVMACHSDKEHHHVHVVVNTVHPYTGRTAPLKFSKLEFSRWAEAYEKEHGIHCEQRIENNERRRELAKLREAEKENTALALLTGKKPPERAPFEPVNDNSPNRRRWFERKEVVDQMKALRAALEQDQKAERGETWGRHRQERDGLDKKTHAKLDHVRAEVRKDFKGQWRDLYRVQKKDERQFKDASHTFERAVFVFRHRERLGDRGKALTLRQMIPLILSRKKLKERVQQIHMRERRALAKEEKTLAKEKAENVWQTHRIAFNTMRIRQAMERAEVKAHQRKEQQEITFARAKNELVKESEIAKSDKARAEPAKAPTIPGPAKAENMLKGAASKSEPSKAPLAPEKPKAVPDARSVLMRGEKAQPGAPAAPRKTEPQTQKKADAERAKDAFKDAAAQSKPAKDMDDKARREFMKKTMERWNRRRPRDDFERER